MQEAYDKFDFHIILESGDAEDLSEYWQAQCFQFYDDVCGALPEGRIEPLNLEGSEGERVDEITFFSTLVASGITGKVFAEIILDAMKTWLEYRPTADIELKCPDGSTIKIAKLPLSKLSKFLEENPQLSVCEVFNRFKS